MTFKEMQTRLATIDAGTLARVECMVRDGFSAHGITLQAPVTLKQANAVFAKLHGIKERKQFSREQGT